MAVERLVSLNPGDELHPSSGRRKGRTMAAAKKPAARKPKPASRKAPAANPSRSAAAKKAAATRRRNAAKRSAAAKKAAATRRRNAAKRNPAARKPAARKPAARKPAARKPAARKPAKRNPSPARKPAARKPAAKKRPGVRRNPGFGGFMPAIKSAAQVGAVLLPLRGVINFLGAWPTKKEGEVVQETLSQKVGPLFDVVISGLALWAVPKFVLKGGLSKYRGAGQVALQANLLLSVMNTVAWYGRRGWDAEKAPLAITDESYPKWTDYIAFPEPQAKTAAPALTGAPVRRLPVRSAYRGGGVGRSPQGGRVLVFNPRLGSYQDAAA